MLVAEVASALDPSKVSPGVAGFLTVFILAIATWLLVRSMTGHLRKVRYRAEQEAAEQEAAEREAAEREAAAGAGAVQPPSRAEAEKGNRP